MTFPRAVKWMVLEFDPQCRTMQAEDALQLYIPARDSAGSAHKPPHSWLRRQPDTLTSDANSLWWPVLKRLHGGPANWPQSAVILPGHEVCFSLETASDYVKDAAKAAADGRAASYGFKCLIVGYEWSSSKLEVRPPVCPPLVLYSCT